MTANKAAALDCLAQLAQRHQKDAGTDTPELLDAVKGLSIAVDVLENVPLMERVCAGDDVRTLWAAVKADLDSFASCQFKTPPTSEASSPVGSSRGSSVSPSPVLGRAERAMARAQGQTVAAVLERDGYACVVTGAMLKDCAKAGQGTGPLEVAHMVGFALGPYIRSFSPYVLDTSAKELLQNGVLVDTPWNCITISGGLHHRLLRARKKSGRRPYCATWQRRYAASCIWQGRPEYISFLSMTTKRKDRRSRPECGLRGRTSSGFRPS